MLKNWVFVGSGHHWKFLGTDALHGWNCVFMKTDLVLACGVALRD